MPNIESSRSSTPADPVATFRAEIDAIPIDEVTVPRIDVVAAALGAVGSMPQIEPHRAALVARFGDDAGRTLDRIEPLARAVMAAHVQLTAAADRDLEPQAREVSAMRAHLFTVVSALIERGFVDANALDKLEGGNAYQAHIVDTHVLVNLLRKDGGRALAHTKIEESELLAMHEAAFAFGRAIQERDKARAGKTVEARDRDRVFTLFFGAYDRLRQMLTYLRWHEDDVEKIAPSLFAGRGHRKQSDGSDVVDTTPANTTPVAPGMPGGDPFHS